MGWRPSGSLLITAVQSLSSSSSSAPAPLWKWLCSFDLRREEVEAACGYACGQLRGGSQQESQGTGPHSLAPGASEQRRSFYLGNLHKGRALPLGNFIEERLHRVAVGPVATPLGPLAGALAL